MPWDKNTYVRYASTYGFFMLLALNEGIFSFILISRSGLTKNSRAMSAQKPIGINDAWTYLQAVKETFSENEDKYDQFLDLLHDFKSQRIGVPGVISRIKEIFKGHDHLILGFKKFVPKRYEISLSPDHDEPIPQNEPAKPEDA